MKKKGILAVVLALVMSFVLCACGGGSKTPQEQLSAYIEENGTENAFVYERGAELIKENSPLGDVGNDSDAITTEEICTISNEEGVLYIEVIDKEVSNNGVTLDRGAKLNIAEGTIEYHNSAIFNGMDMGGTMEVSIPVEGYTADSMPTINSSNFAAGPDVTDPMKEAMQQYVNLAIDCFADFVAQELELTLADFGYTAYETAE